MRLQPFGILLVSLVFSIPATGQITPSASTPKVAALEAIVTQTAATISDWESAARVQIDLTIAAVLFGGLITVLQPWGAKSWCKGMNATLGLAVAVISGVTSKAFPVDYRLYQRSALQARAQLRSAQSDLLQLKAGPAPDDEKELKRDFTQRMQAIGDIEAKLSGNDKLAGLLPDLGGVVYAQSAMPAWVTNPPTSASSLYFVGIGEAPTLAVARANSLIQAQGQAAQYLTTQLHSLNGGAAFEFAKSSTSVEDTTFGPATITLDKQQMQGYRYYTLVRLDKTLTRAGVINVLAESCPAPQFPQAAATNIDSVCGVAGYDITEGAQNLVKNNFCATAPARSITVNDMVSLQKRAQAIKDVNFGNPATHPLTSEFGPTINRAPLVVLGEGTQVALSGYVLFARQEGAESVNCGKSVPDRPAYHDIHISIVDAATNRDECSGVVVEMSPHHRPASWTQQNVQSLADQRLPIRVIGQLMFDSSHTPCVGGIAVGGDPKRASLWEVHPIYKFEVCPGGKCVALEDWVAAGAK
jgi:hypothetical protein